LPSECCGFAWRANAGLFEDYATSLGAWRLHAGSRRERPVVSMAFRAIWRILSRGYLRLASGAWRHCRQRWTGRPFRHVSLSEAKDRPPAGDRPTRFVIASVIVDAPAPRVAGAPELGGPRVLRSSGLWAGRAVDRSWRLGWCCALAWLQVFLRQQAILVVSGGSPHCRRMRAPAGSPESGAADAGLPYALPLIWAVASQHAKVTFRLLCQNADQLSPGPAKAI